MVATLGSLYFSEIRSFVPCVLCWFQRVTMYPLVIVLGVAAFRGDVAGRVYALPLAVIGWGVALVQNLEGWGVIQTLKVCGVGQTTVGCELSRRYSSIPLNAGTLGKSVRSVRKRVISTSGFTPSSNFR